MKNKGISLITLIITIVVVIILAAAVILTLGNKNPVNDANLAALLSNKDNMQGKILFHVTKTAASLPEENLITKTILIENNTTKIIDSTAEVIEITKDGKKINLYKVDKDKYKNNVKDDVAEKPSTGSEWYVDEYGVLYLVYDYITSVPNYMKDGNNLSKNVEDFVIIRGQILEKSIIDNVIIGDKAEGGILTVDVTKVKPINTKIMINDSKNKIGDDVNDYSDIEIDIEGKKANIGMDKLGYRQAHLLVITTDATVEIIKEIEITKPVDVWNGSVATGFARGSGTQSDPYIIETAAQLAYFRDTVNDSNNPINYSGKYVKLASDIDLNEIPWEPIGNSEGSRFQGCFIGGNNSIYNMLVGGGSYLGFFGHLYVGSIENLSVHGELNCTGAPSFTYAAGVCGCTNNFSIISNCKNYVNITMTEGGRTKQVGGITGYISGANIENCANFGTIDVDCMNVGGIVGEVYGGSAMHISNSYNEADVTSTDSYIGGIIGKCNASSFTLTDCYNTGSITGSSGVDGLVGTSGYSITMTNCYSTGTSTRYDTD